MGSWGEAEGGEGEQWLVCKVNKTFKIKNRNILYSKNFFQFQQSIIKYFANNIGLLY